MNGWEWFAATFPAGALVSGGGVGVFVTAILTDRLFTRGQHLRIVNALLAHHQREREADAAHHARELAEKDARIADAHEARDVYKETAVTERARADTSIAVTGEMSSTLDSVLHVMQSLDRALPNPGGGA